MGERGRLDVDGCEVHEYEGRWRWRGKKGMMDNIEDVFAG